MLALLAVAWAALAPPSLGGRATFVIVNGNSMEPTLHRGDLVIVRAAASYQAGDIVTYRHPQIGPVIHRIIRRDGDRYIFKGDHNHWTDSYAPAQAELIGRLWLYLPSAGKPIGWLRKPLGMALMAALLGSVLMFNLNRDQARRHQRLLRYAEELRAQQPPQPYRRRAAAPLGRPTPLHPGGAIQLAAAVLALAALGALSLAVLAFIRPLETATTEDLPYTQSGVFSYTASAPAGLYDAGTAQTGEPIFRKLMNQLQLRFSYTASADEPHQLAGSYRMLAEISAADGWKRSVELLPTSQFTGEHFANQARLNLDDIQALIDAMEQQTGLIHQHYTLAIVPEVTLSGTLGGQALHDTFAPRLEFQLSALELQQQRDSTRSDDPLAPSQKGLIKRTQASPATLGVFGLALDVGLTRWLATIAAVLAGGTAVALSIKLAMANSTNEPARIRRQYGQLLVAVNDSDLSDTDHVVDVATIADLVRIADRDERMILYTRRGAVHYYMVPIAGVNYQYRSVDAVAALAIETERHES